MKRGAWSRTEHPILTLARNVGTRYLAIAVSALIGLVLLPINVRYLGTSAYGLWMLTASVTTYFSVMDLGYGGAVVRMVAEHRARRDAQALNEVLSTMAYLYRALGVLCYLTAVVVSFLLPVFFNLTAEQAHTGQIVLLIVATNVALHFMFSIYGGVINGFESYYLNNVIGTAINVVAAAVNVAVVMAGFGLVELVAATTLVRVAPYFLYRRNAYRVFPDLEIRWAHVRRERLRQLTTFSIYFAVIDWSSRLNYAIDTFVIATFLNTSAVAIYTVGQRLAEALFRMTHQLHILLFPAVVQRTVNGSVAERRRLLIQATRFQLAMAIAACGMVIAVADRLIGAWVGPGFGGSVPIVQLLAYVVVLRAWMAMPGTYLKGSGFHQYVAKVSAASALANVLLSVALVKAFGLNGVALGTVLPVTFIACVLVFPRACRAVQLPVWNGYRRIVWPAVWPGLVAGAALAATRGMVPLRLLPVLAHMSAGAITYAGLFLVWGLDREERQWYALKVAELWKRRSQVMAAA